MQRFARVVLGYHGCHASFANDLFSNESVIAEWKESNKTYDWLGRGIYFWEHSPERARRWPRDRYGDAGVVVGAVLQLGRCFDLMDIGSTKMLAAAYTRVREEELAAGRAMPTNVGGDRDLKKRLLDCLIINACLEVVDPPFQTVRAAFWEGQDIYEGAMIREQSHIQIAVRDRSCILGIFRPTLSL